MAHAGECAQWIRAPMHHQGHLYHGLAFTSVRSTAYLVSMRWTPEIKNPTARLLTRAAIITGATFLERELWHRRHELTTNLDYAENQDKASAADEMRSVTLAKTRPG